MILQTITEKYGLEKYIRKSDAENSFNLRRLDQLSDEINLGIESLASAELNLKKARILYPEINPGFLSVKNEENPITLGDNFWGRDKHSHFVKFYFPNFAIYSLNSPNFLFDIDICAQVRGIPPKAYFNIQKFEPNLILPSILRTGFLRGINFIGADARGDGSLFRGSFESKFIGLIPKKVKEEIKNAQRTFGENVYLISEASWVSKPLPDPLVIGVVKDSCFFISEFNPTPLEEEVIKKLEIKNDRNN